MNGTSGYEEAAGKGLYAGINAVRKIRGEEPFILGRSDAYIGVLVDDWSQKERQNLTVYWLLVRNIVSYFVMTMPIYV